MEEFDRRRWLRHCVKTDWARETQIRPEGGSSATAVLAFPSLHSHLLGFMGCCLISEWWETENCNKFSFQQGFIFTNFPLSGEVNTSEASLYTRARHHHRSLSFKLLKRQWFGVSPPAKESVIERKRDPAFSLRQSLLSPAMAQLLDVHPVLCLLDPFRRHVNSIIHQETKPAGEEGKGEISAGLIELNQLRKG